MSLLNEQIDVRSTEGGSPVRFTWRGRTFRVRRVIGDWPARSQAPGASADRARMLRLSAESDAGEPSIVDIARDAASDRWTVRRQWN